MKYLSRLATICSADSNCEKNQPGIVIPFYNWLQQCYNNQLTKLDITVTNSIQPVETTELGIRMPFDDLAKELEQLPTDLFSLFLIDKSFLNELSISHSRLFLSKISRFNCMKPPETELNESQIPVVLVIEPLRDDSLDALDWAVQYARFINGRLVILHATGDINNNSFTPDEEEILRNKTFNKLRITDYRTLEYGVQIKVFNCDIKSAFHNISEEFPTWLVIAPWNVMPEIHSSIDFIHEIFFQHKTNAGCFLLSNNG